MPQSKGIPTTVMNHNAVLRMHRKYGHKFNPNQVLKDIGVQDITPDKETFHYLISRLCQQGNIDGVSKVLQMTNKVYMKQCRDVPTRGCSAYYKK